MHRIVAVTPAGRRHYLELLHHYIRQDHGIDEWQLWDNCRSAADRVYINALAERDPRIRVVRLAGTDGSNRSVNRFYPMANDGDTFYIKMDDDLVYLPPQLASRLYRRALAERERAIWWSPLIVNNAVCSALLKHHSSLRITAGLTAQASCPIGWRNPLFAQRLHQAFLAALRSQRGAVFQIPDVSLAGARFSINCIGFFGADQHALGEQFCPPGVDDEEWISAVLPVRSGRSGRVLGDMAVAHFSFYTQESALLRTALLDEYYAIAGLRLPELQHRGEGLRQRLRRGWLLRALGALEAGQVRLPAEEVVGSPQGMATDIPTLSPIRPGAELKNLQV
jgi:GT2 family glycosyltransferase